MFYVVLIGAVVALLHMALTLYVVTHKDAEEEDTKLFLFGSISICAMSCCSMAMYLLG